MWRSNGTPGTYERGCAERLRQQVLIDDAGGIIGYLRGVKVRRQVDGHKGDVVLCDTQHGDAAVAP